MIDVQSELITCGSTARMAQDNINLRSHLRELFLSYKFGEKLKYRRSLDILKPYLDERLESFLEEIYQDSLWLNPITGKKGY